jgi:protein TonB
VEKDGSLTDIKVLRDIGYGTGKAVRVLTRSPRWNQVFKMGSRLEYYFSSDPNSNSGLMLEKESKIFRRNRSKSDFFVI